MTYEEALRELNSLIKCAEYAQMDYQDGVDVVLLAICKEALEKQVPKKIIETDWIYCPNCKISLDPVQREKYCVICGQALDWGEAK